MADVEVLAAFCALLDFSLAGTLDDAEDEFVEDLLDTPVAIFKPISSLVVRENFRQLTSPQEQSENMFVCMC